MNPTIHDPRQAVIRKLAERYDHFADMEQVLVAEGRYVEAEGAHETARILIRAYQAETDDPVPS
jgi:hypothetical protein